MAPALADQLAMEVDPTCAVRVVERRGGDERSLRIAPLGEPEARALAAMLLNRTDEPTDDDGPWRCAVAGGVRVVSLERLR